MSKNLIQQEIAFNAEEKLRVGDCTLKYVEASRYGRCRDETGAITSYICDEIHVTHTPSNECVSLEFDSETKKLLLASRTRGFCVVSYKQFSPVPHWMSATHNQKSLAHSGGFHETEYDRNGMFEGEIYIDNKSAHYFDYPEEQAIMKFYKQNLLENFANLSLQVQQAKDKIISYIDTNTQIALNEIAPKRPSLSEPTP